MVESDGCPCANDQAGLEVRFYAVALTSAYTFVLVINVDQVHETSKFVARSVQDCASPYIALVAKAQ